MLDHILTAARTNNHTRLRHYREMYARQVPMASSSDILIEKSPQYAGGSGTGLIYTYSWRDLIFGLSSPGNVSLRLKRAKLLFETSREWF